MVERKASSSSPIRWNAPAAGVALTVVLTGWMAGWTGENPSRGAAALWVLLTSAWHPMLWLAAAMGFGWPLRRWLLPSARSPLAAQAALGVALLLVIDALLGRLGLLQLGGSAGAWVVLIAGILILPEQLRRWLRAGNDPAPLRLHPLLFTAAPALALLLLAACSAPGWLWGSEFGGYDALSYHLQLPREWLAPGRVQGLEHNVYSFFPSYMEGAYYHLAVMIGDGVNAAYACQMLHAGMTLLTALLVGCTARRFGGPAIGAIAGVLVLTVPWTIVVGSLAYNEMTVVLLLAGAVLILFDDISADAPFRRGLALGLLMGAACGAKLTAIGFAALPVALLMMIEKPAGKRTAHAVGGAIVAGLAALSPYLISNWLATGNPVFPFASGIFGSGHWTAEQAAIFTAGHRFDGSIGARLVEGWDQLMRYGIGANPEPGEPWQPQWSILPWLTLAAVLAGCITPRRRRWTLNLLLMIVVQVGFWLVATHVKSRFAVPAVIPAALLVAVAASAVEDRLRSTAARRIGGVSAAIVLLALCGVPMIVFAREHGGRPAALIGGIELYAGDAHARELAREDLTDGERRELLDTSPPATWLNHLLPADSRVLGVGVATPFYYRRGNLHYQTTWDRGPMSIIMRLAPDNPAAWFNALRDEGYTHLLVDPTMLGVWNRSGWNDPLITDERITGAALDHARLEHRWPDGTALYRLEPPR